MTDQDLMLLEMLTAGVDGNVAKVAGVEVTGRTVREWMDEFDEDALAKLEQYDSDTNPVYKSPQDKKGLINDSDVSGSLTGKEWAAIIRQIKSNDSLMDLKIVDNGHNDVHAMCFEDPSTGKGYVAFAGTTGSYEWYDDVVGLHESDTQSQLEALDYIENCPYDNITVVGHSKGGNKAQYVAITSDKVDRCVSMDGQGFSSEFMEKYAAEIQERARKITNISLDTDYVHILLFPVPGSNQVYCEGDQRLAGARNHSPGAYYQYYLGEDGKYHLKLDGDGEPNLIFTPTENKGIQYLHEFTCFVLNVMPPEQQKQVIEYLGVILALAASGDLKLEGVTYKREDLLEFILSDPETLALVIAYFLKYADTYKLSSEELVELMRACGFGPLLDAIEEALRSFGSGMMGDFGGDALLAVIGKLGDFQIATFLEFLLFNIKDGKFDPGVQLLLTAISVVLKRATGVDVDLGDLWKDVEADYHAIGPVNKRTANKNASVRSMKIYDYSQEVKKAVLATMTSIDKLTCSSVSSWKKFSGEKWYASLEIAIMIKGVNKYFENLAEVNADCKQQIDHIFERVWTDDLKALASLKSLQGNVHTEALKADQLRESIL